MASLTGAEHTFFTGIGGIGVSALAQLALASGIRVSGSDSHLDVQHSPALRRLADAGATLYPGHHAGNIADDVTLLVATAAVSDDNPELVEARRRGIRTVSRAAYLGELMSAHHGPTIAVAGTHGKTTTTGMLGVMLKHAGLEPTVFVGGEIPMLGGNVALGTANGPFVAEACEAYDSFLWLKPEIAIVTNIEADHLDHYNNLEGVYDGFRKFLKGATHTIVCCASDPGVQHLSNEKAEFACTWVGYGSEPTTLTSPSGSIYTVSVIGGNKIEIKGDKECAEFELKVPGLHNIANALAAACAGVLLGVSAQAIADGLASFGGATRRQDKLADVRVPGGEITVIDDYAHHPTEIAATVSAISAAYQGRRLLLVFQPHLYSRTRDFMDRFAESLSHSECLLVTAVYAARETPIPGVHAAEIVQKARGLNTDQIGIFVPDRRSVPATLLALSRPGDVALFMGAGDIREQAEEFVQLLRQRSIIA